MFQYAAARRLALKRAVPLNLDITNLENQPANETPRKYELGCFRIQGEVISATESASRGWHAILDRLIYPIGSAKYTQGFGFNPDILVAPSKTVMIGSWQSPRYFEDVVDQIRSDFSFKRPPTSSNIAVINKIKSVDAVSLHVRRGDYASDKVTNRNHGLAPLEYYQEAVRAIEAKTKNSHFFIFSDDPFWCKKNLKIQRPTTYVEHNKERDFEDLRLMSLCNHHIVANSTFSWWGAWLNPDHKKIVVAPRRWFTNPAIDTSDFTPSEWLRL